MRERLLYAINTCKEIDTDFVVATEDSFVPDDGQENYNGEDSSESENDEESGSHQCTTQ